MKFTIASRSSELALYQAKYVKNLLLSVEPSLEIDIKSFLTRGDRILDKPLSLVGGKGLFTKELQNALLNFKADIAVHSLKDISVLENENLCISAFLKRENPLDIFLSQKYKDLDDLPKDAIIGTSSLRRKMQVLSYRNDLNIRYLRGNINTRIEKLKEGLYDAIILAAAGVDRLCLRRKVNFTKDIEQNIMVPAMGQGILAVESLKNDKIMNIVKKINNKISLIEAKIERDFVRVLDGNCQVPIAIKASYLNPLKINISTVIGLPNAKEILKQNISINEKEYKNIGVAMAKEMIKKGAKDILKRAQKMAFE